MPIMRLKAEFWKGTRMPQKSGITALNPKEGAKWASFTDKQSKIGFGKQASVRKSLNSLVPMNQQRAYLPRQRQ